MSDVENVKTQGNAFQIALGFLVTGLIIWLLIFLVTTAIGYLRTIPKEIAAPLITAAATVIVATITVMVGRYYERKKEIDALYRDKKTEIYDEFLDRFFKQFFGKDERSTDEVVADLVPFLREFTRKLILWSGPEVIEAFLRWKDHLAKGTPDAKSLFLTEEFLIAIRKDLRHPGSSLQKGFFARLFLTNGNLFLAMAKRNPNLTLNELAEAERLLAEISGNSNN